MIDLTPLDVRNKRGDFKRLMRGYDPQEVDVFLEMVADRLEVLVRENLQLNERTESLQDQVATQSEREQAVQDALVTAQELRADIRAQAQREAEHVVKEAQAEGRNLITRAEGEAKRIVNDAEAESLERVRELERRIDLAGTTIQELERRRVRFLKEFRGLLARELDVVEVEQEKLPFEERAIDLDLGVRRSAPRRQTGLPRETEPQNRIDSAAGVQDTPEAEVPTPPVSADDLDRELETDARWGGPTEVVGEEEVATPPPSMPPGPIGPPAVAPVDLGGADLSDTHETSGVPSIPVPHPVLRVPRGGGVADEDRGGSVDGGMDPGPTIDVGELSPGGGGAAQYAAGGTEDAPEAGFRDVPDLETLLAEAGVEDASERQDDAPSTPAARERREDSFILFDFDEKRRSD
jgi:DivIVA domain-containing protein